MSDDNATSNNLEISHAIVRNSGVARLVALVRGCSESGKETAACVLGKIAMNTENRMAIVAAGGV